jgi:predicted Fe-Mo cluster-binding NifX family protein
MSQRFGQSAGFIVFEVEGTEVKSREVRANGHTPHAQGLCGGDGHGQFHAHSHNGIVGLLHDCSVVLYGGMGAGAAQALLRQGLQPVILPVSGAAQELLSRYLKGEVSGSSEASCQCRP